jgi:hypothetical protein
MGQQLAKSTALSTAWVNGDMESWTALAMEGIEQDARELVGELSHIVAQLAGALARIEGPDSTSEIVLQQLALDGESTPEE